MKNDLLNKVDPRALHVMWVLALAGFDTRLCGGAVRDILKGKTPKDWDMATTARPEVVMSVMKAAGVHTIPTGLQHGTITAMFEDEAFEITTLRVDQETDGRHATVEFTNDWKLDASRRDFTMNAMYLDADGVLHDYFGGQADLESGHINFVGDAERRIQEDYLRILRYFRFKARMLNEWASPSWDWRGKGHGDAVFYPIKSVIRSNAAGLETISGERIWMELQKIIQCERSAKVTFTAMRDAGVLDRIGLGGMIVREKNLDDVHRYSTQPSVVLASTFAKNNMSACLNLLKDRYHVSKEETRPIEFFNRYHEMHPTRINAFELLAEHEPAQVVNWLAIHNDTAAAKPTSRFGKQPEPMPVNDLVKDLRGLVKPPFPVTGQDLIDYGIPKGPEVGRVMKELRQVWAHHEFCVDRDYLMNLLHMTNGMVI